ncbi:hypothetical protein F5Y14DRAFT_406348 [Nemania sp. NC0429]|nr:hypothetical protein F5Y14DRAFT_406348 [Nemania sp. NC0429]
MYRRLRHLQGIDIPRCFGIVYMGEFDPALLLSYIEGKLLYQLSPEELLSSTLLEAARTRTEFVSPMPRSDIANPQLLPQLRRIYSALAENGVAHGDPRLDNFIQTKDGRVVAIDLEFAHLDPYDAGNTDELNSVLNLMGNTVDFQSLNNPAVYRLAKEDYKKRMAEREDQPLPWHPPSPLPSMSGNKAAGG